MGPLGMILGGVLAVALGVVLIVFLFVPLAKGIAWLVKHLFKFIVGEIGDVFRILGAVITSIFFAFLSVGNIIIGRWSASAHFGRGLSGEIKTIGACLYRIAIGHPARLLCLTSLTEGIENRLPRMVAEAPTSDTPSRRSGQFEGYKIVGSIAAGGSGGKLFIAEPDDVKLAAFLRQGIADARQVVIKSFSLKDGSSLPQIVRESRSLDAAKKLGPILDHDLSPDRFYYVMRYVPGQSLALVTKQLHGQSGSEGLNGAHLRSAMTYIADLLATLETYHRGGLWHKDVKPDNIIVDGTRAHLVDFGLVTPLRSAMTLTTHGTEYFRDPEMVRLALKGVKVHEVDGTKFDLYGAGAVLYSVIEDSFPAHGVLSAFSKNSPEAVKWIVRRAMADYEKRYATAGDMLADLRYVMTASDPANVKPFELPSMRGQAEDAGVYGAAGAAAAAAAAAAVGANAGAAEPRGFGIHAQAGIGKKIKVLNWWTGKSSIEVDARPASPAPAESWQAMGKKIASDALNAAAVGINAAQEALHGPGVAGALHASPTPRAAAPRVAGTAAEQLERARARVHGARERAKVRYGRLRNGAGPKAYKNGPSAGVFAALAITGAAVTLGLVGISKQRRAHVPAPEVEARTAAAIASVFDEDASMDGVPMAPVVHAPQPPTLALAVNGSDRGKIVRVGSDVPPPVPAPPAPPRDDARDDRGDDARDDRAPTPQPAVGAGKSLLFINEILPPFDPDTEKTLTRATDRIRALGFTLVGSVPGRKVSDLGDEQKKSEDELMVEARRVQGTRPIDAKETRQAMQDWLAAEGEERPAGVVWIAHSPESEGKKPKFYIFTPTGGADSKALADRVKQAITRTKTSGR